jgi:hypothetical protein
MNWAPLVSEEDAHGWKVATKPTASHEVAWLELINEPSSLHHQTLLNSLVENRTFSPLRYTMQYSRPHLDVLSWYRKNTARSSPSHERLGQASEHILTSCPA